MAVASALTKSSSRFERGFFLWTHVTMVFAGASLIDKYTVLLPQNQNMLDAERLENTLLKRQGFYAEDSALSVLAHPR